MGLWHLNFETPILETRKINLANFFSDPLWGPLYWPQKDNPLGSSRHVANRIAYTVKFTIIGLWHFNFETP